jgi:hypothetical protein
LKRAATYDNEYSSKLFVSPELAEHSTSRVKRLPPERLDLRKKNHLIDEEPEEELE